MDLDPALLAVNNSNNPHAVEEALKDIESQLLSAGHDQVLHS